MYKQLTLPVICDTFVYYLMPYKNFSNYKNLLLISDCNYYLSKVLFKLPLNLNTIIKNNEILIAKLCFTIESPIGNLSDIQLYKNTTDYDYRKVTWCSAPKCKRINHDTSCTYNPQKSRIEFDLTCFINEIDSDNDLNLGLQIVLFGYESKLLLNSSRTLSAPFIELKLNPSFTEVDYLQAEITNNINEEPLKEADNAICRELVIPYENNIPFNKTCLNCNITLNTSTGDILIPKAGVYIIDWLVNFSSVIGSISINLSLNKFDKVIDSSCCICTSPGIIYGHSIVDVLPCDLNPYCKISLKNNSTSSVQGMLGSTVYLAPVITPASIRIICIK